MKIAYIINSLEGGGAASPVPAITGVMRDYGAQVRVYALTGRDRRGLAAMQEAGLEVICREGGEKDHVAALRWLNRQIRDWQPDLLWTSLTRATLLGQIIGAWRHVPVVSWQHNAYLKSWNERLLRMTRKRSMLWVADSRCVEELTARRLLLPPNRLMLWPIFAADKATPSARAWQPGETLRLGSLGRLHQVKGYDVLLAALARLKAEGFTPPARFEVTIAGDGAQGARLAALARESGLDNVRLPGFASDPRTFLTDLHLYVQPSRAEGFCIAAHEAMLAGLPVIVSAVGEMPYTVAGQQFGMVVPPADVAALAEALADMLADPAALHAKGLAARALVLTRFSQEHFAEVGRNILSRVLPTAG